MALEYGYLNITTKTFKGVKYKPSLFCDLYLNQGKTCPIVEKIKSTTDKIVLQGDFILDICMHGCIHFIKRDIAQLLTNAGL